MYTPFGKRAGRLAFERGDALAPKCRIPTLARFKTDPPSNKFGMAPGWNCILLLASCFGNLVLPLPTEVPTVISQSLCKSRRNFVLQLRNGLGRVPWDELPFFRFQTARCRARLCFCLLLVPFLLQRSKRACRSLCRTANSSGI